jgi:hypothetical protein
VNALNAGDVGTGRSKSVDAPLRPPDSLPHITPPDSRERSGLAGHSAGDRRYGSGAGSGSLCSEFIERIYRDVSDPVNHHVADLALMDEPEKILG